MGKKTNFLLGQPYKPNNYWSMIYVLGFIMGKKTNFMLGQPYKPDKWGTCTICYYIKSFVKSC